MEGGGPALPSLTFASSAASEATGGVAYTGDFFVNRGRGWEEAVRSAIPVVLVLGVTWLILRK